MPGTNWELQGDGEWQDYDGENRERLIEFTGFHSANLRPGLLFGKARMDELDVLS